MPLAIVPVGEAAAPCVPLTEGAECLKSKLGRRLMPGPLRPKTAAGRALLVALRENPERFVLFRNYELTRAALGSRPQLLEQAEALVLSAYTRLHKHSGAPARPAASSRADYDAYAAAFGGVAIKALESTMTPDFQLIAKAHVLGIAQSAAFPRLRLREAKHLYSNAMRFGHALRQAETRFQAAGAAGTFVPLSLEVQLAREELEDMWCKSDGAEALLGSPEQASKPSDAEGDAEAAQRSLREVLKRMRRFGDSRPGLATYLGWLGRYDPEALAFLASPQPVLAMAMKLQVEAVWGPQKTAGEDSSDVTVAVTPADMIEALLFGAWLRDAAVAAEETLARQRQQLSEQSSEDV